MKLLKDFFRIHIPEKPVQLKAGIYHFRREAGGNVTRFHLRVEEDGTGVLLANASVAARLWRSGVMIAKARLEGVAYPVISKTLKEGFSGGNDRQIESDVRRISQIIGELANLEDNYPIFNLDNPSMGRPRNLLAPFHAQMHVASPEQINPLLEKLWNSGIMHVTFSACSAGVPPARNSADETSAPQSSGEYAIRNVERAEDFGMISGVRGSASWFLQTDLFQKLALAGVDYITVPAISANPQKQDTYFGENNTAHLHECFQQCKKWEVTPVLEVAIFRKNMDELETIVKEFSAKGVNNVLYYAIANDHQPDGLSGIEIIQSVSLVTDTAHRSRVRYVWLPAVSAPGELKTILEKGPRTAGDVSIRVDPDGAVYAPRGPLVPAGNLSTEPFTDIWNREVFRKYRERVESQTRCEICPELEVCGADCPADPAGWARGGTA